MRFKKRELMRKEPKREGVRKRMFAKFALAAGTIMIPIMSLMCGHSDLDKARIEENLTKKSVGINIVVNGIKGNINWKYIGEHSNYSRGCVLFKEGEYLFESAAFPSGLKGIVVKRIDDKRRNEICPDITDCVGMNFPILAPTIPLGDNREIRIYPPGENKEMVRIWAPFGVENIQDEIEKPWWGPDEITHVSIPKEGGIKLRKTNMTMAEEMESGIYAPFSLTLIRLDMDDCAELPNRGKVLLREVHMKKDENGTPEYYVVGTIADLGSLSNDSYRLIRFKGYANGDRASAKTINSEGNRESEYGYQGDYGVEIPEQDLSRFPKTKVKLFISHRSK